MATRLQLRRGTEAENNAYTGAVGEITIDTTNDVIRIHDGVTPGGFATAMANSDQTLITGNLLPAANVTYNLGNSTNYWNDLYLSGNTIFLGPLQLKASDSTTFSVYGSDGVTLANIGAGSIDVASIASGTTSFGIPTPSGNAVITVGGTANVLEIATNRASLGGALTATGNITGSYIFGNGSQLTGIDATSIQNGTANVKTLLNGNVTISAAGTPNVVVVTSTGANIAGTINATGNANVGNLGTDGNITASYLFGNGSQLTGIDATSIQNGTSNVKVTSSGGNVTTSVGGQANVLIITSTGANITGTLNATGNANVGNLGTSGNITASYLFGNGSQLQGIDATSIQNGTSNVKVTSSGGNVTTSVGGTANVLVVSATGANITGTLNATGNANVGNLGATNIVGTLETASQPNITSVGTLTSLSVTGNISGGNVSGTSIVGTLTTAAQTNITSVGTLTSLSVTGNISGGNVSGTSIVGTLTTAAQTNITSLGTLGSLSVTGNISGGNVSGTLLTGTLATVAQPNVTSLGTLTSLNIQGNINQTGNLNITGNVNVTGNLNYQDVTDLVVGDPLIFLGANNNANLDDLGFIVSYDDGLYQYGGFVRNHLNGVWGVFGNVVADPTTVVDWGNAIYQPFRSGAATFAGANINGALSGITTINASGNANVGNISATNIVGTLTTAAQTNITSVGTLGSLSVTGNISGGNVSGTSIVGTLTTAAQTNITSVGTLGSLSVTGNISSGNISATNIVGTLTTAAQTNITSVGTLTSLSVTGNIAGGNVSGTLLTGTLATVAQPNVTSLGTLTSLTVTGNLSSGNAILGNLATANFFSGNGSLLTGIVVPAGNSIVNGNSNVVVGANANITFGATGVANVVSISSGALALGGGAVFANPKQSSGSGSIPTGVNAMLIGPYVVSNGDTITAPTGSTLIVI
jgi:hypothetical protein